MAEHANVYPLRRAPAREPQRAPQREPQPEPRPQEPLWREVLGRRLRALRQDQQETLSETAARAGLSPQYLSEIERGRKEPSSEMIAALAGALGLTVADLMAGAAADLRHDAGIVALATIATARTAELKRAARAAYPSGPVALAMAA
jgi:transcriptional regulator with XRE-family HTH domain